MFPDEYFMQQAIALAERGRGYVSPNPLVGAIIVKNNKIIATGYHKKFGDAHAEINALRTAKTSLRGATLYVTLEPCNFLEKKTPPCAPAIIKSGIKRVVIGMQDCNPKTCGQGILALRHAGIKIKVGVLKQVIEKQNESYFKFMRTGLPWVNLKLALSLDGRIANQKGQSKWITNKLSRQNAQTLRKENDAILVGINTILHDNPHLTCRIERKKKLLRVILDPNFQIPTEAQVLKGNNPTLVLISNQININTKKLNYLRKNVEILSLPTYHSLFSWSDILTMLAKRNIASLLIEGGAQVASSALQAKIVDKIYFYYAPKILGAGLTFSDHLTLNNLKSALILKSYQIKPIGNDFLLEGYLH